MIIVFFQVFVRENLVLLLGTLQCGVKFKSVLNAGIHDSEEEWRAQCKNDHGSIAAWKSRRIRESSQSLISASAIRMMIGVALESEQEIILERRREVPRVHRRYRFPGVAREAVVLDVVDELEVDGADAAGEAEEGHGGAVDAVDDGAHGEGEQPEQR